MTIAATLTPATEVEYLRKTIRDAEQKLASLSVEEQRKTNLAIRERQYIAAKAALDQTRQRHASLQGIVEADLETLKRAVADAHLYSYVTDPNGAHFHKGYRASRTHVTPANPQHDPAAQPAIDSLAQKLVQSIRSEFQARERLAHAEKVFAEQCRTSLAQVAPKTDPVLTEIQEGTPTVEIEQPVPVSTKAIVHEALTTV